MKIIKTGQGNYELYLWDTGTPDPTGIATSAVVVSSEQLKELFSEIYDTLCAERTSAENAARYKRRHDQLVHNINRKPRHDIPLIKDESPKFITETELSDEEKQKIKERLEEKRKKTNEYYRQWHRNKRMKGKSDR